MISIVSKIGFL